MTLLAEPAPKRLMQFRASTLPPRCLTLGAVVTEKNNAGHAVAPHVEMVLSIGTQMCPDMVSFVLPTDAARALFHEGLHMCNRIDGGIAA